MSLKIIEYNDFAAAKAMAIPDKLSASNKIKSRVGISSAILSKSLGLFAFAVANAERMIDRAHGEKVCKLLQVDNMLPTLANSPR